MKRSFHMIFAVLLLGSVLSFCQGASAVGIYSQPASPDSALADSPKAKKELLKLIRQVLIWSDSCQAFALYPVRSDAKDSAYVAIDRQKVDENIRILRQTGFFANIFIMNYRNQLQNLDVRLQNKELVWLVGDLPPFSFNDAYSGLNPWCLCQGFVVSQLGEIEVIQLNSHSGDLKFKWKQPCDWVDFRFGAIMENNQWKITYLEGLGVGLGY